MAVVRSLSQGYSRIREGARQASPLLTVRNILLVILALALWWRLMYTAEVPGQTLPVRALELHGDETSYNSVARNLMDGKGYLNSSGDVSVVPPVYPTFLAAVYTASDNSLVAVKLAQAVIGTATCAVVFFIGRRAFNPATGLVAAGLAAAYPWFIFWNRFVITETLFIFLLSLSVLAMLWAAERPVWRNLALAGVLIGLANLTHSTALLLPVLFGGWLLLSLGLRRGAPRAGLFLAAFVLTLAPWTLHNYIKYNELIPIAAHGGTNLYYANNPYTIPDKPHYSFSKDVDPADLKEVEDKPFLEQDRILRNKAIDFIFGHPRTAISNGAQRIEVLWEDVPPPSVFNMPGLRLRYFNRNIETALELMFLVGAVAAFVRWRAAIVLLLLPLQTTVLHVFFPVMGNGRSRVIFMQVVIVLAGFSVYAAWRVAASALVWASALRSGGRERFWRAHGD